jgi:hypothetical protein
MAIPGVTPTQVLMSLDETDDQGNIGAALGYGSQCRKKLQIVAFWPNGSDLRQGWLSIRNPRTI